MNHSEIQLRFSHFERFIFKVGEFLKSLQATEFQINKKARFDLVTEADLGSEKMVRDEIQKNFPNDGILGEEGGEVQGTNEFRWVIDPLDGTTNFSHKIPLYGVSIGLENLKTKKVEMGLVFFPELNDFYYAIRGKGSFKNGKPISVSKTSEISDALLSTGFPYTRDTKRYELLILYYKNILIKSRGVRRTGAATLDLCWLAEGKFDAFWEAGLKPWDTCASSLIVEEAGGVITTFDGNEFTLDSPTILATNSKLHGDLLLEFQTSPWY